MAGKRTAKKREAVSKSKNEELHNDNNIAEDVKDEPATEKSAASKELSNKTSNILKKDKKRRGAKNKEGSESGDLLEQETEKEKTADEKFDELFSSKEVSEKQNNKKQGGRNKKQVAADADNESHKGISENDENSNEESKDQQKSRDLDKNQDLEDKSLKNKSEVDDAHENRKSETNELPAIVHPKGRGRRKKQETVANEKNNEPEENDNTKQNKAIVKSRGRDKKTDKVVNAEENNDAADNSEEKQEKNEVLDKASKKSSETGKRKQRGRGKNQDKTEPPSTEPDDESGNNADFKENEEKNNGDVSSEEKLVNSKTDNIDSSYASKSKRAKRETKVDVSPENETKEGALNSVEEIVENRPKRGRGQSKKQVPNKKVKEEEENDIQMQEEKKPKRGRTQAKVAKKNQMNEDNSEEENHTESKRKRGRGKKDANDIQKNKKKDSENDMEEALQDVKLKKDVRVVLEHCTS